MTKWETFLKCIFRYHGMTPETMGLYLLLLCRVDGSSKRVADWCTISQIHAVFFIRNKSKRKLVMFLIFHKYVLVLFLIFFLIFPFPSLIFLSLFLVSIEIYDKKVFIYKRSLNCDGKLLAFRLFKGSYQKFKNFALESKKFVPNFFLKQLDLVSYFLQKAPVKKLTSLSYTCFL